MKLTEQKRQDIIQAAMDEFREQGFLGAQTKRIAQRAGVSSRTLYNHFENKEALFDAISKIMIERNRIMPPIAYNPDKPLEEQFLTALQRYLSIITEKETMGLTRMIQSELLRDLEKSQAFFAEFQAHDHPITNLVADAMKHGALRDADPHFATHQLLGLAKTFFFWPELLVGKPYASDGTLEQCVEMFLSYYKLEQ